MGGVEEGDDKEALGTVLMVDDFAMVDGVTRGLADAVLLEVPSDPNEGIEGGEAGVGTEGSVAADLLIGREVAVPNCSLGAAGHPPELMAPALGPVETPSILVLAALLVTMAGSTKGRAAGVGLAGVGGSKTCNWAISALLKTTAS